MQQSSQKNQNANPKQNSAYSLSNFTILLVEDYHFMMDLMSTMLREFGVGKILQAVDIQEAKEMLTLFNSEEGSRNAIDIVIVDWLMPNGDGVEILKWIRDHRKNMIKFLPTILCSAYASEEVVIVARDHGANEALVKPVSAIKLAKRILHVVDHPRPYIKAPDFFGPDRRRQDKEFKGEDRRKQSAERIKEFHDRI